MNRGSSNLPASIHQRLLNRARAGNLPFNELLQYYVLERFLYRLSRSSYNERLILKGGLMFAFWQAPMSRPTRDVDLLDTGNPSTTEIVDIMRTICDVSVADDGIRFDTETLVTQAIRAQEHACSSHRLSGPSERTGTDGYRAWRCHHSWPHTV